MRLLPSIFLLHYLILSSLSTFGASPTGTVTITGTAEVGQTLTASNNLADADGLGTITYQWYRNGQPIQFGGTLKDGEGGVDGLWGAGSMIFSANGGLVYITAYADDSVSWFDRNSTTGVLTYVGQIKDEVGGVNRLDGVSNIALSPDGIHAYVVSKIDNAISRYAVDSNTGALSYYGANVDGSNGNSGLDGAQAITLSSDGLFAYAIGRDDDMVSWFSRTQNPSLQGNLTQGGWLKDGPSYGVDGLDSPSSFFLSPDGDHVYVASFGDNAISWYDRNSATGALTYQGMAKQGQSGVINLNSPRFVTLSPDGKHAYVLSYKAIGGSVGDAVLWFDRNSDTGALSYVGSLKDGENGVDGLDDPAQIAFSSDGLNAYIAGLDDDSISWYERNATTGALSFGGVLRDGEKGVHGLDGAKAVIVSPDDKFVYVTGASDSAVNWFVRDLQTGALSYAATNSSYNLTPADLGTLITVRASYTDGGGTDEQVASLATDSVANTSQSISWSQAFSSLEYGAADIALSASASSGLSVTYESSNPAILSIVNGNKLRIHSAGQATVTAKQAGDANYAPQPMNQN